MIESTLEPPTPRVVSTLSPVVAILEPSFLVRQESCVQCVVRHMLMMLMVLQVK